MKQIYYFIKEKFDNFVIKHSYKHEIKSIDWKSHQDLQMDILFGKYNH